MHCGRIILQILLDIAFGFTIVQGLAEYKEGSIFQPRWFLCPSKHLPHDATGKVV